MVRYIRRLDYEVKGKVTGYRVLDVEGPKIEVSITQNGTLKGRIEAADTVDILEYRSAWRGVLYGR
jgi:hypothetical protein